MKYELTDDFIEVEVNDKRVKLYKIKALVDIPAGDVKVGDLGGYIEKESNLSHSGNAWVYGDAMVSGDARVSGDASVSGNARVYGDARVSGNASVSGNALVYGNARVSGDAWVYGDAMVSGNALVRKKSDLVWFSNVGTENGTLTVYKAKDGSLLATRGCFSGSVEDFLKKSTEVHDEKTKREYQLLIEVARSRLEI
ncbi:polymer-forming cytoskeletal protein [Gallibacterium salpingitidis]|uniref:polymer-forming cytoskeletal protein n=1 Tax=Gallibacterium salpingitidis TaxID=505341 RepID=UPI00266F8A85|nr:polymer-forming cytoskeletal protein [Gallibacterium salpingitidis]WKS98767.1 polymer-forming cytoskeletal protein [Gallibacterium salpingitidis]